GQFRLKTLILLFFVLLTMAGSQTQYSDFHLAGDYLLGGLFSLHTGNRSSPHLSHSRVPTCQLKIASYSYLRAMRFAVEQINNSSTLLPGVSLGYEMVDVCYFTNFIHPILYFLSNKHSVVQLHNNYTHYQPRVLAVIGPDSSQAVVIVAQVLSLFLMPQISYSATSNELNDRERFPSVFRTISSMEQQIRAMLLLLQEFRWNWINILYSDDDYGRQNLKLLRANTTKICVALQDVIPVPQSSQQLSLELHGKIKSVVSNIIHSTAKVVIILSLELTLQFFFQEAVRQNVTDLVWIATEAWATEPTLYNITDLWRVGTILGVAVKEFSIPGFDDFRVSPAEGANKQASDQTTCNQACDQCLRAARDADHSMRVQGERIDFNVYSSVYIVAHALHRLLGCNTTGCHKRMVYPWQLVPEMKRVNFSLLNKRISFRERGNTPNSFEIIQWNWDQPNNPFQKIASYSTKNQTLLFTIQNISWHTPNNTVPISVCSQQCEYGQRRKPLNVRSCCFECIDCEKGTFLNNNDLYNCQPCPADQWSSARSQKCYPRLVKYLEWQEGTAVVLLLFSVLGLVATVVISVIFAIHSHTPVVKSAGGRMCFLMLVSLIIGFINVPMYIGIPTEFKCMCRQIVYSFCFTVCISCITVRSFQIISIFKMAARLPKAYSYWMKYNGQYIFITVILALKVTIIVTNVIIHPPTPVLLVLEDNPSIAELQCNKSYKLALLMNNSLDTFLSILCFYFSYIGKELPKNYNEAKYITLCMTCYAVSEIAIFLVMSVYRGVLVTICDALGVVINLLGVSMGYFGPKCYLIFFHPERNTAAYFQSVIQSYTMRQD
uniref:Taste receptor type 1 member 2 n=1 Tax=Chelonoidis abingdonii TaxID=106734 RepID=A0A8C0H7L4_CHEAB